MMGEGPEKWGSRVLVLTSQIKNIKYKKKKT